MFETTSTMQNFMVLFHMQYMQDTKVTVHTWFHLDETPLTSLLINSLPHHQKCWYSTLINVHETSMKPALGLVLSLLLYISTFTQMYRCHSASAHSFLYASYRVHRASRENQLLGFSEGIQCEFKKMEVEELHLPVQVNGLNRKLVARAHVCVLCPAS